MSLEPNCFLKEPPKSQREERFPSRPPPATCNDITDLSFRKEDVGVLGGIRMRVTNLET